MDGEGGHGIEGKGRGAVQGGCGCGCVVGRRIGFVCREGERERGRWNGTERRGEGGER